ncbi:hypothetical protein VNO77_10118 [Canavalia gladiata]|uniref:Uncharacterized protein n=1 Tax=Canavalia gladiata TaxID=3824 RepID=A0AAN9R1V0_CANGL
MGIGCDTDLSSFTPGALLVTVHVRVERLWSSHHERKADKVDIVQRQVNLMAQAGVDFVVNANIEHDNCFSCESHKTKVRHGGGVLYVAIVCTLVHLCLEWLHIEKGNCCRQLEKFEFSMLVSEVRVGFINIDNLRNLSFQYYGHQEGAAKFGKDPIFYEGSEENIESGSIHNNFISYVNRRNLTGLCIQNKKPL